MQRTLEIAPQCAFTIIDPTAWNDPIIAVLAFTNIALYRIMRAFIPRHELMYYLYSIGEFTIYACNYKYFNFSSDPRYSICSAVDDSNDVKLVKLLLDKDNKNMSQTRLKTIFTSIELTEWYLDTKPLLHHHQAQELLLLYRGVISDVDLVNKYAYLSIVSAICETRPIRDVLTLYESVPHFHRAQIITYSLIQSGNKEVVEFCCRNWNAIRENGEVSYKNDVLDKLYKCGYGYLVREFTSNRLYGGRIIYTVIQSDDIEIFRQIAHHVNFIGWLNFVVTNCKDTRILEYMIATDSACEVILRNPGDAEEWNNAVAAACPVMRAFINKLNS